MTKFLRNLLWFPNIIHNYKKFTFEVLPDVISQRLGPTQAAKPAFKCGLTCQFTSQMVSVTFGNPEMVLSTTWNQVPWCNKHGHRHSGSGRVGWPILSVCLFLVSEMTSVYLRLIDFVSHNMIISWYVLCINMSLVILIIFLSPLIAAFLSLREMCELPMHHAYILHCAVCTRRNFNK